MERLDLEIHKCSLCYDAPCKKIYKNVDPERIIRALRFDNLKGAKSFISDNYLAKNDDSGVKCPCNVDIDYVLKRVAKLPYKKEQLNVDITTTFCGLKLKNPFLLSSSVVGSTYDMCKRALQAGWAGVVFKTMCPFDIHESSPRFSTLKNWDNSFAGFKNIEQLSIHTLEEDCNILKRLKKEFPSRIIIASIMGRNEEEWESVARIVTESGCDAIELNFSCPNMEEKGTGSDIGQEPEVVKKYTMAARRGTSLPLIAKMTPNITDIRIPARAAKEGGANGISAINTIKSITNIDFDTLVPEPNVNGKTAIGGYSGKAVKPIALRFVTELANDSMLNDIDISGIGGIYTYKDAIEFLLLGATNVQLTTAIMEYGYRIIDDLILGLKIFMKENNFHKVSDFVGISKKCVVDTSKVERDTILFPKFNYDKCVGYGRCFISCQDGGHSAIKFGTVTRKPQLDGSKCVGCHLCKQVCPNKAISVVEKRIINKNTRNYEVNPI